MLWQEDQRDDHYKVPDKMVDLAFRIDCRELPIDHAYALSVAVKGVLPWLEEEPAAAIHSIHGAASGNGWNRPQDAADSRLQLSRRTRFYLRLPKTRCTDAAALSGSQIDVAGYPVSIGLCQIKPLVATTTVFCRSMVDQGDDDEERFIERIATTINQQGIEVRKLLCGLQHRIATPTGDLTARSVLLADLGVRDSIALQQSGIGSDQLLGCGIFLPHKDLAAVGQSQDED